MNASSTSSKAARGASVGAKILVVDDDPVVREVQVKVLKDIGHTVFEAGNGEEALRLTREQHPDLILLDLKLPGLSGIDVCKQLRAEKVTRDIPIIVVTGMEAKSALEESIIAGADDFLAKPVDALELSVRVRSMLRVRNIHDEEKRLEAYLKHLQPLRSSVKSGEQGSQA